MKREKKWTETLEKQVSLCPEDIVGFGIPWNTISEDFAINGIINIECQNYFYDKNEFEDDNISPTETDYYYRI